MNYLVAKNTHHINFESWFDEEAHAWLKRGAVCWNPDILCMEGEEEQHGYSVADIPEEEVDRFMIEGEEDLYWINGKVLPRNKIRISYLAYISHPDFPDQRQQWIPLSDRQIGSYQGFVVEEFSKFCTKYPKVERNDELWHNWLEDAFADADFVTELPNAMNPVPAHVDFIDINHPNVESL